MVGIYKITNPKGNIYIGQSLDIYKRFRAYKKLSCKNQIKLHRSFLKYGVDSHKFEVIWLCNKYELNYFERKFQIKFNCIGEKGLNLCLTNDEDNIKVYSSSVRNSISIALKGIKHSDEHRLNNSKAKIGNNSASRRVINTETGEEFISLRKAAEYYNISYGNLKNKMSGFRRNNTKLIYKNDIP